MLLNTWTEVLALSFQNLWVGVVGALLGRAIWQVFKSLKVDDALRRAGFDSFLRRGGIDLDSGAFVGGLVKWFVIVMFLIAALDVLGLSQVNLFLQEVVLGYLPQVLAAALVLLAAGVIGDVTGRVVVTGARTAGIDSAHFVGVVAKWAIWIFAILVALSQLGIAVAFSQTLFTGVVIAVSLALGLSFGLGGQETASRFIEKIRGEISGKNHN